MSFSLTTRQRCLHIGCGIVYLHPFMYRFMAGQEADTRNPGISDRPETHLLLWVIPNTAE
jgi:hypothetical protein